MPRSSNAQLSTETVIELENQFFNFLDSLSYDEKKQFFNEFLTNEEKMMMYKRLALYWSLLEGYPLAKIQQMIGVTHDTTRVYNKKKNLLSDEFRLLIKRVNGANLAPQQQPAEEPKAEPMMEQLHEDLTTMEVQNEIQSQESSPEPEQTNEWQEQSHDQPQMQAESHDEHHEEHQEEHQEHHEEHHEQPQQQMDHVMVPESIEDKPLIHSMDGSEMTNLDEPAKPMEDPFMSAEEKPFEPQINETERPVQEETRPMDEERRSTEENKDDEDDDDSKEKKKGGWGKIFGF